MTLIAKMSPSIRNVQPSLLFPRKSCEPCNTCTDKCIELQPPCDSHIHTWSSKVRGLNPCKEAGTSSISAWPAYRILRHCPRVLVRRVYDGDRRGRRAGAPSGIAPSPANIQASTFKVSLPASWPGPRSAQLSLFPEQNADNVWATRRM